MLKLIRTLHAAARVAVLATLAALAGAWAPAAAQIAVYDTATGLVHIPSVAVGGSTYTQVVLKDLGGLRFGVQSATLETTGATPAFAVFDTAAERLSIPVVNVGTINYTGVSLRHEGNLVFSVLGATETAAPPRVLAPPRWLEVWTSTNADTRSGTYALSVANPDAPGTLLPVDSSVPVADFQGLVARVRGGSYDPATGRVADPGVRHLIINRGGQIYRVSFDRTSGAAPVPARLSNETAARGAPLVQAQSATGDDALIGYGVSTGSRYVRLSADAASAPLRMPSFPGDLSPQALVGSVVDPERGTLTGLLWSSLVRFASGSAPAQYRLFRTGADFQSPTSIAVYNSNIEPLAGSNSQQRMARGWAFRADGALRRYDFASGSVSVMQEGLGGTLEVALPDEDGVILRGTVDGSPRVLRCVDAATARCATLLSGAAVGTSTTSSLRLTRRFVQIVPFSGTVITTVNKADGALAQVDLPAGGLLRQWLNLGFVGQGAGDRLFYWRNTGTRNLVGSIAADGSDRQEFDGTPIATQWTMPSEVAAHRLGYLDGWTPYDKVLVRAGVAGNPASAGSTDRLAWLDGTSGLLSADLGTVPSRYFSVASTFPAAAPPYPLLMGSLGAVGLLADVQQPTSTVKQLDAFLLGTVPPSLRRLSNLIP